MDRQVVWLLALENPAKSFLPSHESCRHDDFRIIARVEKHCIVRGDTNGHLLDESQSKGMDGHAARLRVPRQANLRCEDHMDHNWLGCRLVSWRG
jgi:hypothetical protein